MTDRTVEKVISPIESVEVDEDHFKARVNDSSHEAACVFLTLEEVQESPVRLFVDGEFVMRAVVERNVIHQEMHDLSRARLEFVQPDRTRTSHRASIGDYVQRPLTSHADSRLSDWQIIGRIVKIQSNRQI